MKNLNLSYGWYCNKCFHVERHDYPICSFFNFQRFQKRNLQLGNHKHSFAKFRTCFWEMHPSWIDLLQMSWQLLPLFSITLNHVPKWWLAIKSNNTTTPPTFCIITLLAILLTWTSDMDTISVSVSLSIHSLITMAMSLGSPCSLTLQRNKFDKINNWNRKMYIDSILVRFKLTTIPTSPQKSVHQCHILTRHPVQVGGTEEETNKTQKSACKYTWNGCTENFH